MEDIKKGHYPNINVPTRSLADCLWRNSHEVLLLLSLDLVIIDINLAGEDFFNTKHNDIVNQPSTKLFSPRYSDDLKKTLLSHEPLPRNE